MAQEVLRLSVKNFLSHSAEKNSRGNLLCCVSENFWQQRNLWIRGGGSIKNFRRTTFSSQCRKNQQGDPSVLCFRKSLVAKIFMDKKGEYQEFPLKIFCLTVPKNFVAEPFSVSLTSGIEKLYASEGYVTIFCRTFLVSQCRKNQQGRPFMLCFRSFPVAKKFIDRKGGKYQEFPPNFVSSHSVERCRRGFLQSFIYFGYGENLDKVTGESIKIFRRICFLTVPKKLVG